jgi:hypothetical protein
MFRMLFCMVLEEKVYMCEPPGFVDRSCPQHLCRLEKALYGLKPVPRTWHARLGFILHSHGFVPSTVDTSMFLFQRPQLTMYLLVYVDDIIVTSSESATDPLVTALGADFALKDLGKLYYFLALEVTHCDAGLTQQKYSMELTLDNGDGKFVAAVAVISGCGGEFVGSVFLVCVCRRRRLRSAAAVASFSCRRLGHGRGGSDTM